MTSPQVDGATNQTATKQEPAKKETQYGLLGWTVFGIALTGALSFGVMTVFVRLIDGEDSWWKIGDHDLDDGQWFEAARVTVALVALTVAGGAAYLAYRRQRTADENQQTAAETQRITAQAYQLSTEQHQSTLRRELRARFTDSATQLAHPSAAVRIAGVYALAALADDWHSNNEPTEVQTCVDVLCGYLRLPFDPEHAANHQTKRIITRPHVGTSSATSGGEIEEHFEYRQNDREVRKTIVRVIRDHLGSSAVSSWSDRAFDFQDAVLEDPDFSEAVFLGSVSFLGTQFHGKQTLFDEAKFHGESTLFNEALFHGESTSFNKAEFRATRTSFREAQFHGKWVLFREAQFHGHQVWFDSVQFHSELTSFDGTQFHGGWTVFDKAKFHGRQASFAAAQFHVEWATFDSAEFRSSRTSFRRAQFHGEQTSFEETQFHGEWTFFASVQFHSEHTSFHKTQFHGERTSFESPAAWDHVYFDWDPQPPYAPTAKKPSSVLPEIWPPAIRSG